MNAIGLKVSSHPFFSSMPREYLDLMATNSEEVSFRQGEVLFGEGEPANRLYLILSGKVALDTCGSEHTAPVQTLGEGDVLGWSWLFPPFSWHFRATALEPTRAIVLDGGYLLVTCEGNPAFGYALMKKIAQMVINRLESCQCKLAAQNCGCPCGNQ